MRKWLPLVAVCLGSFMLLVDVTIVNVALPDMAADLSTSFTSLQWVIDIYALALAALLLGFGSFADVVGRRRVYLGGLVVFAAASLVAGIAPNTAVLITARAVQGLGGAAMFATTLALLNSSYQGRDRGTAFGIWGAVSAIAAAVGPIAGGLLTQHGSWRWIFFVNLPISVIAVVMTLRVIAADQPGRRHRIDIAGIASFTLSAGAITFALIRASDDGWLSARTLGLLALGAVALVGFVMVERRTATPVLDLALFRSPRFVGVLISGAVVNFSAFAYLAYTSLWLQTVRGLSPVEAGLAGSLPISVAAFLVSAGVGRFLHHARPHWIVGGGLTLVGAGALMQARLSADSSWTPLLAGLIVSGIGVGLAVPTLVSTAMGAVPVQRGGMAAGAVNTARQLGYAFGVAVLGSVVQARAEHVLRGKTPDPSGFANALTSGQAQETIGRAPAAQRGYVDGLVHAAFASGLNATFAVAGGLGIVAGLFAMIMIGRPVRAVEHVEAVPAPA
ncbi:MAG TPA: MFS transporter [Jatrophihabitantaceae bacterium]|nr:MFS transporter [Jatrophihabitantaceae bacterium]